MFIVHDLNIDYLIPQLRLHVGDYQEPYKFDDSIMRTALVHGIEMLQRRWGYRYMVFSSGLIVDPLPEGVYYEDTVPSGVTPLYVVPSGYFYIKLPFDLFYVLPSSYVTYDVFRHPLETFVSPSDFVVSQEDEVPVILAASITLRRAVLSSSAEGFASWSDGEFSYSNLGTQRTLVELLQQDIKELETYFKLRLAKSARVSFLKW